VALISSVNPKSANVFGCYPGKQNQHQKHDCEECVKLACSFWQQGRDARTSCGIDIPFPLIYACKTVAVFLYFFNLVTTMSILY